MASDIKKRFYIVRKGKESVTVESVDSVVSTLGITVASRGRTHVESMHVGDWMRTDFGDTDIYRINIQE